MILSIFSMQTGFRFAGLCMVFVTLTRCLFHLSCCPLPHLRKLSLGWRELWANVLLHQMVAIWESFSPENLTQPLIDPCMQLMPAWHQRWSVDPEYWHYWHLCISRLTYFPIMSLHLVEIKWYDWYGTSWPAQEWPSIQTFQLGRSLALCLRCMNYHEPLPRPIANMPSLFLKKLVVTKSHEKIWEAIINCKGF